MIQFKRKMLCFILSALFFPLPSFAETLHDVVAHTICSNPDVKIAEKVRNASNEEVTQAFSGYLPKVDLNGQIGYEHAKNVNTNFQYTSLWRKDYGIAVKQPLFDGFATRSELKRTRAKTDADAYKVQGTAEDVALAAVQAYLDVLRNEELVAIARRNVAAHEETFGMVRQLSEQGLGREADTVQTSGRLDLARSNLRYALNNLDDARITFRRVVGYFPCHLAPVPDVDPSVLPQSLCDAIQRALACHPILKSAYSDIIEAHGQHEASWAPFYPRFDLVVLSQRNHNASGVPGPNYDNLAAVQMQYNIFKGGFDSARTRQTAFQVQEATEIRNRTYRQVVESMELSWAAFVNSSARLPLLALHRDASAGTSRAYLEQFKLNKRTLLDVLDSKNELFVSQQDYANERYALIFAKYRILNSMGKLTCYLHVALPCEAHVPYHQGCATC